MNQRLPGTGCASGSLAGATDDVLWTQHITTTQPDVVPFPATWPREPLSTRQRIILATTLVVILVLLSLGVGVLVNKYFRLSALDDYRAGYAQGVEWRESGGAKVYQCESAMASRYGPPTAFAQRATDGWGEFRVGCENGLRGEPPVSWLGLRERMRGAAGLD